MSRTAGSANVLESKEYAALTKWVTGKTNDLGASLDAFCEPVEDKFFNTQNPSDVEGLLWTAWQGVVGEAASTPHNEQHKLVEFVTKLASRPALTKGDQTCTIDNMTVWRDLPVFGWELREAWNLAAGANSDQKSKDHWINLNTFVASLVSSLHSTAQDRPDYSLFGLWTIRTALEEQGDIIDTSVAAASTWISHCAPALWAQSKQSKSFDGKVAAPGSSFKAEEWTGFSEARWTAWKQNLKDVERGVSDQSTARMTQDAIEAMERAEK